MSSESYVLLRLEDEGLVRQGLGRDTGAFVVSGLVPPAVLIGCPINGRGADFFNGDNPWEEAALYEQVRMFVPATWLDAHRDARGFRIAGDGGEPHRRWPRRATYDDLVTDLGGVWLQHPTPPEPPREPFMAGLEARALRDLFDSALHGRRDVALFTVGLLLGPRFAEHEPAIDAWLAKHVQ